ncbi:hypothetical protein [Pseudocolwellia sp. HL-MZ7]|uniref:hypothetical protein n=1 Tax=Pseudocolwellia sp. HL-MZ7 TaxID=3400627 RepID=UPI003CFB389B
MKLKNSLKALIKFTLLDDLVGFIYWVLALYGLFLISNNISGPIYLILSLVIYIVIIAMLYILFLKKLKRYFV